MGHEQPECEECLALNNQIDETSEELESMTEERDKLQEKIDELEGTIEQLKNRFHNIDADVQQALNSI